MQRAWNPKYELRDYQREWCGAVKTAFEQGIEGEQLQRVLGVAGTGAGKTIMAAALMYWVWKKYGGRSLFLADRDKLVTQGIEKIFSATGIIPGREQAEHTATANDTVVVGSVQTLQRESRLDPHRNRFKLVIADEAHLSLASNWQTVLNAFPDAWQLGITATPGRTDKKSLLGYYQHLAASIDTFALINLGALVPIMVETCPIRVDATKADSESEDQEELAAALEPYWDAIIDEWIERARPRKTLIFHPSRKASRMFTMKCLQRGIRSAHVQGDSKDLDRILQSYRRGDYEILNNAILLSTGYDEPTIQCVMNLRKTTSRSTYQQIIGRGTRLWCPHGCQLYCDHEDAKRNLLVLDLLFQFASLGVMRPADLITENQEQKLAIQRILESGEKQLNIQEIDDQVTGARELAMIKALKQKSKGQRKVYDARSLAAVLHIPALMDHESSARWELQEATPKQLDFLSRQGIDPDTIKDRGHASAVMTSLVGRFRQNLATPRQVAMLAKWGIEDAHKLNFETAKRTIDEKLGSYRERSVQPKP